MVCLFGPMPSLSYDDGSYGPWLRCMVCAVLCVGRCVYQCAVNGKIIVFICVCAGIESIKSLFTSDKTKSTTDFFGDCNVYHAMD